MITVTYNKSENQLKVNFEMITAREAAEKADKAYLDLNNGTLAKELPEAEKEVTKAIAAGLKTCTIYKLSDITQKHLQSLGYKVTYHGSGSYRGEDYYTIDFK